MTLPARAKQILIKHFVAVLLLGCATPNHFILDAYAQAVPPVLREPAAGVFLVANKTLGDANFARSVVLLTDYSFAGAIGLIINRSSNVTVVSMVPSLEGLENPETKLHFGGPLNLRSVRVLVGSSMKIESFDRLLKDVYFVNDTAVLRSLLEGDRSNTDRVIKYYAGYAAWSPGQLDREIARGDWYLTAADADTVFTQDIESVWPEFIEKLAGTWVLLENTPIVGKR